jgi:hypothetical protein
MEARTNHQHSLKQLFPLEPESVSAHKGSSHRHNVKIKSAGWG